MTRKLPRFLRRIFHRSGHRGKALENSIRGLFVARRHGYKQTDLDCTLTRDGVPVIHHGPPAGLRVWNYTWPQIRRRGIRRAGTMFFWARRLGLRVMLEVKFDQRFEDVDTMRWLKGRAEHHGADVRIMTLQNHGDAAARLRAAHAAGFETVLLVRGRKPHDWETRWAPHVTYLRGRWH